MVLVKPTARWLGRTQRIPRGRKIERNGLSGKIDVTDAEAKYLTGNFFATLAEEPEEGAPQEPGEPPEETHEEVPAGQPEGSPVEEETPEEADQEGDAQESGETPPPEETLVLDYLNATEPEAIAQQIKGIGRKTADELVAARPLTWEAVNEILSDRQLETLVAFVTSND